LDLNTFNHIPPNVRRFRTWTELAADPKASPPNCPGTRSPYGLAAQTITLAQILPTTTVAQWKWPSNKTVEAESTKSRKITTEN